MCILEQPAAVNAALARFLETVEQASLQGEALAMGC